MQAKIRSGDVLVIPSVISFTKLKPTAEEPFKESFKSVGYEITIIERTDNRTDDIFGDVNLFSTGLILNAPKHYHLEIIEHPALHKAGYMLIGGPRIINPDNTEELVIPLYKFKEVEDIELPFRAAIMVLRQTEYCSLSGGSKREMPQFDDRSGNRYQNRSAKSTKDMSQSSRVQSKVQPKGNNHMF